MKKLRFRLDGQDVYYTTKEYLIEDGLIKFTDKFGKKQIWNKELLISIDEVER